jgi:beta-glucosidase
MIYSHTRSHEPQNQGRRYWDEASTPLFPFGHGLSYSRFTYSELVVDQASVTPEGDVTVSVRVTNAGDREATDVVQLYLHQRYGTASRPVRELKGFERVTLAAGASRQVVFPLGPEHRRYWSATTRDWVLDETVFDVWVGGDSTADLSAHFEQRRQKSS